MFFYSVSDGLNLTCACSKNVIATASTKEKLDFLLNMPNGATHAVNYRTEDFAAEVKKITEGKGVDVILDFVGRTHWEKNISSLAVDGRMTIFAFLSGASSQWCKEPYMLTWYF